MDDYRKRADALEARAIALEEENQRLLRENERSRDQLEGLTDRVQALERELREDRAAREDATEQLARSKLATERLEQQLALCVGPAGGLLMPASGACPAGRPVEPALTLPPVPVLSPLPASPRPRRAARSSAPRTRPSQARAR